MQAEEIFKTKLQEKAVRSEEREVSVENLLKKEQRISQDLFQEKIKREIRNFQFNLLREAKKGNSLKIDILEVHRTSSSDVSRIKGRTTYRPIAEKVITFLEDTNFDLLGADIIEDEILHSLYDLIVENDLYPQWKIRPSEKDPNGIILYLEVNPLISFNAKQTELQAKFEQAKRVKEHAMVHYQKNIETREKVSRKKQLKEFVLSFLIAFYISMVVLTVISAAVGIFPIETMINTFGFVAVAWPYYLMVDFSLFFFSLPLALFIAFLVAFRRI